LFCNFGIKVKYVEILYHTILEEFFDKNDSGIIVLCYHVFNAAKNKTMFKNDNITGSNIGVCKNIFGYISNQILSQNISNCKFV